MTTEKIEQILKDTFKEFYLERSYFAEQLIPSAAAAIKEAYEQEKETKVNNSHIAFGARCRCINWKPGYCCLTPHASLPGEIRQLTPEEGRALNQATISSAKDTPGKPRL